MHLIKLNTITYIKHVPLSPFLYSQGSLSSNKHVFLGVTMGLYINLRDGQNKTYAALFTPPLFSSMQPILIL